MMRRLFNYVRSGNISRPSMLALLTAMLVMVVAQMPKTASPVRTAASAATDNPPIVVTTVEDEDNGTADSSQGAGTSLREAINAANAADGDDEINFAVTGTINLTSALPLLNSNIKINGPGASALTVRTALSNIVIFNVQDPDSPVTVAVTIAGMTLSDGVLGVRNFGTLELINCTTTGTTNTATSNTGVFNAGTLEVINCTITGSNNGGIFNIAAAKVTNSTVTGNHREQGGGINNGGTLEVTDSTISNNNADEDGGGIYNEGFLTMTNCTVSGNSATKGGGIYIFFGILKMANCTVSDNSAANGGGLKIFGAFQEEIQNTIIGLNTAPNGPDVLTSGDSVVTSVGHNLIGNGDGSADFTSGVNGNQVGTTANPINPLLGPLQNNGGPTPTRALLCGSPAIDHGDNSVLNAPLSLTTDQRGAPRPFDGDGNSTATVDIGAFELNLYCFSGFFQPVDNVPTVNVSNAGSAIPVKFQLGGNRGLNIFAMGYPVSQQIACSSGSPVSTIEETVTAGGSSLSYDAGSGTYTYVWKTDKAWKNTCRKLIVKLNDGTTHEASFKFK